MTERDPDLDRDHEIHDTVLMGGCAWIMVVGHILNMIAIAAGASFWEGGILHPLLAMTGIALLCLGGVLVAVMAWPGAVSRGWGLAVAAAYSMLTLTMLYR